MEIPSLHAIRLTVNPNTTLTVTSRANSGTIYYGVSRLVSSTSNDGSIAAGSSQTFTGAPVWMVASATTEVDIKEAHSPSYTLTFATAAARTLAADTAAAVATTAATNSSPYGYSQAQADALVAAVNALLVDLDATKTVLKAALTDLRAQGLLG